MAGPPTSTRAEKGQGPAGRFQLIGSVAPLFPGCSSNEHLGGVEAARDEKSAEVALPPERVSPLGKGTAHAETITQSPHAAASEAGQSGPRSFRNGVGALVGPEASVFACGSPAPFPDTPAPFSATGQTSQPTVDSVRSCVDDSVFSSKDGAAYPGRTPNPLGVTCRRYGRGGPTTTSDDCSPSSSEDLRQRGKGSEAEEAVHEEGNPASAREVAPLTGEERDGGGRGSITEVAAVRLPDAGGHGNRPENWPRTPQHRISTGKDEKRGGGSAPEKDVKSSIQKSSGEYQQTAAEKRPQLAGQSFGHSPRADCVFSQYNNKRLDRTGDGSRPRQRHRAEVEQPHHTGLQGEPRSVRGNGAKESKSVRKRAAGVRGGVWEWCDWVAEWFLQEAEILPEVTVEEPGHLLHGGPLRFDRPDETAKEALASNNCPWNVFSSGSARSETEASYIRAYSVLELRHFAGSYAAAMSAASGLCAFGALLYMFVGVFFSFPSASESTTFSFVPPPRALALSCFLWAALVSAFTAAGILVLLFFSHFFSFYRAFLRGRSLSSTSSSPPPVSESFSGFSLEAPFDIAMTGEDQILASPTPKVHGPRKGDDRSCVTERVSLPTSVECIQNARDALFGAAFLMIYGLCARGDLAGAEETASSCANVDAMCDWGEEGTQEVANSKEDTPSVSAGRALQRAVCWNARVVLSNQPGKPSCSVTSAPSSHGCSSSATEPASYGEALSNRPAKLVSAESSMRKAIFRTTRLIVCVAFFATVCRLLLLVAALAWGKGNEVGRSSTNSYAEIVTLPFSYLSPATAPHGASAALLDNLCSWLAHEVAPLLAIFHYAAVALLVRPRKELGILEKQATVFCLLFGLSGIAEVILFPGSSGRLGVFWKTATSTGLRLCVLFLLLSGHRLLDCASRQYFLPGRSREFSSLPAGLATRSAVLASTARTAAAASTLWALAVKKHTTNLRQRHGSPSGSSCSAGSLAGLVPVSATVEGGATSDRSTPSQAADAYWRKQRELVRLHKEG